MLVLRAGELEQEFTLKEFELAIAIGKAWVKSGMKPTLYAKQWNGNFVFHTHLLHQKRVAA
jgi:hypothetical protein